MLSTVIGAAQGVLHCVCELMLDVVDAKLKLLIKQRSNHGPEAVRRYLFVTVTHGPKSGSDTVIAERPAAFSGRGKNVFIATSNRLDLLQHF